MADRAVDGAILAGRVTPIARANTVAIVDGTIGVGVRGPPADGKANGAVVALLAKALGVAKTRYAAAGQDLAQQGVPSRLAGGFLARIDAFRQRQGCRQIAHL